MAIVFIVGLFTLLVAITVEAKDVIVTWIASPLFLLFMASFLGGTTVGVYASNKGLRKQVNGLFRSDNGDIGENKEANGEWVYWPPLKAGQPHQVPSPITSTPKIQGVGDILDSLPPIPENRGVPIDEDELKEIFESNPDLLKANQG